jgi:hypothetical protein
MNKNPKESPGCKTYKELAAEYRMSGPTFRKLIRPIRHQLRSVGNNTRLLVPADVLLIYENLGPPD